MLVVDELESCCGQKERLELGSPRVYKVEFGSAKGSGGSKSQEAGSGEYGTYYEVVEAGKRSDGRVWEGIMRCSFIRWKERLKRGNELKFRES